MTRDRASHGTSSRYAGGCRCYPCTDARRRYIAEYRAAGGRRERMSPYVAPAAKEADLSWRLQAACRHLDPDVFFPAANDAGPAKAVCATCQVVDRCLEYALATKPEGGVWGGMVEAERRALARKRRRTVRA